MSQKIKKQIKKTIPYFMIFSLLFSTTVAGLVFNLDFKIVSTVNKHLGLEIGLSEAKADTASTTVQVRNAPPAFSGNPVELPAHAANTPVNVGETAYWQATANDPEANQYFLIVCASDSVIASSTAGSVPACGGGVGDTFCVSAATNSGAPATCTDVALADPGAESDVWYAFVCDNHSTEADCSLANQGAGDSGSPIYINHAPVYDGVFTSDNSKGPGGTFTVTATTSDNDIEGGADEIYLTVCSTNGYSTTTGCVAATWCTGTSTNANVSCSFATSTPARDNTYTYYAFVRDWHNFQSVVQGRNATYTVINVAPVVSNVIINGGGEIRINSKGMPEAYASSSADLYDANSCLDVNGVNSATSSIYISSSTRAIGGQYCADDPNFCYQMTTTECSYVADSCTGSSDTTSSYICSTTISYLATPSDITNGNPYVLENWLAGFTAIDDNGLKGSAISASGVELIGSPAIGVNELSIPYGSIRGNQDSGNNNATTTVVNLGNTPLNTIISGTSMYKLDLTDVIVESRQQFSLLNFDYTVGNLSSTTPATVDTITPKPTDATDITDQIFWGIGIPGGTSSGNYVGTNSFVADVDPSDW